MKFLKYVSALILSLALAGGLAYGAVSAPYGILGGAGTFAQLPGNYAISITASAAGAASATLTSAWPNATTSTAIAVWPDGESRTVTLTLNATTITWTTNIATSGSGTTLVIDGQTTPPGAGTAGFTSDFGEVVSNGTTWQWGISGVAPSAVAAQVLTGCATITPVSANVTALRFTTTATTCNPQLLLPYDPNGWFCVEQDGTAAHAVVGTQSAIAVNGCTVTMTTTSGDTVIVTATPL